MDIKHCKDSLYDIVDHNDETFKPQDTWFAWLTMRLLRFFRPWSTEVTDDEYDDMAVLMQDAALGHDSDKQPPEIKL